MEGESFPDRISRLETELRLCGNDIMEHITGLYSNNITENVNLKNDPRNAIKMLQHDVIDCLQSASERSLAREEYTSDVDNCRDLMDIISRVSIISTKLVQCEEAVGGSDLLLAHKLISEIKVLLVEIPAPNTEIGTGAVCKILSQEARLLRSRLQARMKRLLCNCIVFEYGRLSITKRLKGMLRGCGEDVLLESSIELCDIWTALVGIGSAKEIVDLVVENIWQYLLRPLWKERRPQSPHSFTNEDRAEIIFDNVVRDYAMSAISSSGSDKSDMHMGASRMPFPQLLEQISQILSFMWTEVFCGNEDIIQIASAKFYGDHNNPSSFSITEILVDTLTSLMPKNEGDLIVFQRIIEKPCKDFEVKLLALGLYPSVEAPKSVPTSGSIITGKKSQSLSDVVVDMNSRFADVRRKEILGRGRDLLLSGKNGTVYMYISLRM